MLVSGGGGQGWAPIWESGVLPWMRGGDAGVGRDRAGVVGETRALVVMVVVVVVLVVGGVVAGWPGGGAEDFVVVVGGTIPSGLWLGNSAAVALLSS